MTTDEQRRDALVTTVPSMVQFPRSPLAKVTRQLHCLVLLLLHQDEHRIEPVCSCLVLELIYQAMHWYGGISFYYAYITCVKSNYEKCLTKSFLRKYNRTDVRLENLLHDAGYDIVSNPGS